MFSVCLTLGSLEAESDAEIQGVDLLRKHSQEKWRDGNWIDQGKGLSKKVSQLLSSSILTPWGALGHALKNRGSCGH